MLELKEIGRVYRSGSQKTVALDGISLCFHTKGMTAVLGPSGSGKTTFLNIIGGLDKADCGEMRYYGTNTEEFTETEWDNYRNNTIGFIFQNFDLMPNLTAAENVELALSISGWHLAERRAKAREMLEKLGLSEQADMKPCNLSSGQKQKIAIARALVNDPSILLCDEPTGALDAESGIEIMELLQKESRRRLVILVTHNMELADLYADRVITFRGGRVEKDTKPYQMRRIAPSLHLKKTNIDFMAIFMLGLRELLSLRWRALLLILSSCTGIVCLMTAFSLSTGLNNTLSDYEAGLMARYPVIVTEEQMNVTVDEEADKEAQSNESNVSSSAGKLASVFSYDDSVLKVSHKNKITDAYIEFIKKIKPGISRMTAFIHTEGMNVIRTRSDGQVIPVTIRNPSSVSSVESGISKTELTTYPVEYGSDSDNNNSIISYLEKHYELLSGSYPAGMTDLCVITDEENRVNANVLSNLGFVEAAADGTLSVDTEVPYNQIIGMELELVHNDDYYLTDDGGLFYANTDYASMAGLEQNIKLRITGVFRAKDGDTSAVMRNGVVYSNELTELVFERGVSSRVAVTQRGNTIDIFTGLPVDEMQKQEIMTSLGADPMPEAVVLYPLSFDAKSEILSYLDEYNDKIDQEENKVYYTDLSGKMAETSDKIFKEVVSGLKIFAIAAFLISFVMIFMSSYSTVRERTRDIGVFRAIGARKRDVVSVVDTGAFVLGFLSGFLGVLAARLLMLPINSAISSKDSVSHIMEFDIQRAIILVVFSILLTVAASHLPARMASGQDPAEALWRS